MTSSYSTARRRTPYRTPLSLTKVHVGRDGNRGMPQTSQPNMNRQPMSCTGTRGTVCSVCPLKTPSIQTGGVRLGYAANQRDIPTVCITSWTYQSWTCRQRSSWPSASVSFSDWCHPQRTILSSLPGLGSGKRRNGYSIARPGSGARSI